MQNKKKKIADTEEMKNKSEFSELAQDLDKKFKDIKRRQERSLELVQKKRSKEVHKEINQREEKFKEHKKMEEFRIKEKLFSALIVFILGHILLIPMYIRFSAQAPELFCMASLSLAVICVAVMDYG